MAVPLLLLLSFLRAFAEGDREEGGEALQEGAQRPLHRPQGETPSLLALALAVARRAFVPETRHFLDGLPLLCSCGVLAAVSTSSASSRCVDLVYMSR